MEFNAPYFGNKLPSYTIRVMPCTNSMFRGHTNRWRRVIRMVQGQPDADAINTLIHEMAHHHRASHHAVEAGDTWRLRIGANGTTAR
jgi:hypothetical protein